MELGTLLLWERYDCGAEGEEIGGYAGYGVVEWGGVGVEEGEGEEEGG